MSAAVFVDTGGWYALQVPNDRWHTTASSALRRLLAARLPLVTTNHVLGETYTLLMRSHGHAAAWRFFDAAAASAQLEIVHADAHAEREAWATLRRFADQSFSFVDAVSFAVMRQRRLKQALAFDRHFATAGFVRAGVDAALP